MKILIVTNADSIKLNHIADSFGKKSDIETFVLNQNIKPHHMSIIERIFYKFKLPIDTDKLNKRILKSVLGFQPDIVFIIKGNMVYPSTLKQIKKNNSTIKLISWSLDDMYAWHNRSLYYTLGLKLYDVVFTSKSYNLKELKQLGAKKVKFFYQAYSKKYHKPCNNCNNTKFNYDVLFIGAAEKERIDSLNFLASNGIKIYIYGGGWDKINQKTLHRNLIIHKHDLIGSDYADALSCAKISLCFLRKANRDLHTSRSIEIPACGGFMLSERTDEHSELFEEDKEAVYFDNDKELLEKVQYYLEHEYERKKIAHSGYTRCLKNDYSYDDMVKRILYEITL